MTFDILKPGLQYGPGRKNHMKGVTRHAYDAAHKDDRDAKTISRQTYRADLRRQKKALDAELRTARQKLAGRALLDRQARRERDGVYDGKITVAVAKAHKRAGRLYRRILIDDISRERAGNLRRR